MRIRVAMMTVGLALALSACSHWFVEDYPDLIETEKQLVQGCTMLGVVTETADAGSRGSQDQYDFKSQGSGRPPGGHPYRLVASNQYHGHG